MVLVVKIRYYVLGQEDPQKLYTQTSYTAVSESLCELCSLIAHCTVSGFFQPVLLDGLIGAITFFTQRAVDKGWNACLERTY